MPPDNPSTATAVDRETAWLTTSGDGLPALPRSAGGVFDTIQAYWPRTPSRRGTQLYVLRDHIRQDRSANIRQVAQYTFRLRIIWPMSSGQGAAEADQRELDEAIEQVLRRVGGFLGDKTHGGRFLSVAEDPRAVEVQIESPERGIAAEGQFSATVTYRADDFEINN